MNFTETERWNRCIISPCASQWFWVQFGPIKFQTEMYFFYLNLFLLAKFELLDIIFWILKPPAPLKPGLCLHFLCYILPGRCEFTPPYRGKNFQRRALFFEGATWKVKLLWNTHGEYYRMNMINVRFFL